jgi:hypothetical protein
MEDLRLAVAGLNSTMSDTHLDDGAGRGQIGDEQPRWFGQRLRRLAAQGWTTVAAIADRADGAARAGRVLADGHEFGTHVAPHVQAVLHDPDDATAGAVGTIVTIERKPDGLVVLDRPLMSGE